MVEPLRQEARLMAFGPNRRAEVNDEAQHLFPQQDSGGRPVLWHGLDSYIRGVITSHTGLACLVANVDYASTAGALNETL